MMDSMNSILTFRNNSISYWNSYNLIDIFNEFVFSLKSVEYVPIPTVFDGLTYSMLQPNFFSYADPSEKFWSLKSKPSIVKTFY
jgi:hypothetical protein